MTTFTTYASFGDPVDNEGWLNIYLGNCSSGQGDGTFTEPVKYDAYYQPSDIIAGDFNSDGIQDIITVDSQGFSQDSSIHGFFSVFLGNGNNKIGDGTFADPVSYQVGTYLSGIADSDFNSDEISDLAVTDSWSDNVYIFLGNGSGGLGDGTFTEGTSSQVHATPSDLLVGDFNSDNIKDLAIAHQEGNHVSILFGNGVSGQGDGTFRNPELISAGPNPCGIESGDFNSDGTTDLAVTNCEDVEYVQDFISDPELSTENSGVSVLLGNSTGNGSFADPVKYQSGLHPTQVQVSDMNNDGIMDLVVTHECQLSFGILLGNGIDGIGDGTFEDIQFFGSGGSQLDIAISDFNSDGYKDFVIPYFAYYLTIPGSSAATHIRSPEPGYIQE